MNERSVKCSFVVIKLKIHGNAVLLGQADARWRDVTFVGGHANYKDRERPEATARREVLEELSALRRWRHFSIEPLCGPLELGPKWSKSANSLTRYTFYFYLLRFNAEPRVLVDVLAKGRGNVLFPVPADLDTTRPTSDVVHLLDKSYPGGLQGVPYSWNEDLGELFKAEGVDGQLGLSFSRL